MIPKNNLEEPQRSDYQKPNENSLPNQKIINGPGKQKNVYQIEENDEITNSIDMNYEINMDINPNVNNMRFSGINFENIDGSKGQHEGQI